MTIFKKFKYHWAVFFSVIGPGFITAMVDNDAGGILTYSQAGAKYGYLPLWTLLPITILLVVTQEMCSRMGAVTGKGLSDLIREEFGLRITFGIMLLLVMANLTNIMAEFAGVGAEQLGQRIVDLQAHEAEHRRRTQRQDQQGRHERCTQGDETELLQPEHIQERAARLFLVGHDSQLPLP